MHEPDDADSRAAPPTIDGLVAELRRLRQLADNPSYAELASRISRSREASGESAARARVARSTVYDVFRPGRRRLDVGLVREVLTALGLDDDATAHWAAVARRAVPSESAAAPRPAVPVEEAGPEDLAPQAVPALARRVHRLPLVLLGCVAGNLAGRAVADLLGLPLHLDMVWTAVAAILLGPWWGVLVGLFTNGVGVAISGADSLPFALVNVTGALIWGYGVRRFGLGRTIPRFFALNVVCAVACSVVATPILQMFFDGTLGPQTDRVGAQLSGLTHVAVLRIFLPNLVFSLADKTLSGFVALAVLAERSLTRIDDVVPVNNA